MRRSKSLSRYLSDIVLLSVIPLGLFSSVLLVLFWYVQTQNVRASHFEAARAAAAVIDAAVDSTISRIEQFARFEGSSEALLGRFASRMPYALELSDDWMNVILLDRDGRQVVNLRASGRPVQSTAPHSYQLDALRNGATVVSDVFVGRTLGMPIVDVATPLRRNGKVDGLIVVALRLDFIDRVLRTQGVVPDGLISVFDRQSKLVADSDGSAAQRGVRADARIERLLHEAKEGVREVVSPEGEPDIVAWATTRFGFKVFYEVPAASAYLTAGDVSVALAAIALVAIVLSATIARVKRVHLLDVLREVRQQVSLLGEQSTATALPKSGIREVDETFQALRNANELLGDLLHREQEARLAADAANRSKTQFLAVLSHELRTPISTIKASAIALRSGLLSGTARDNTLDRITRQTDALVRIVDEDFNRVITRSIQLQPTTLDLGAAVGEIVATMQVSGPLKGRIVRTSLEEVTIRADGVRLSQVVTNLLSNAARYSPRDTAIEIAVCKSDGNGVLKVIDHGVGIEPEIAAHIFDLFYQGASGSGLGGSGIGLAITKRLVELHEGRITVESPGKGKGATFIVHFPLAAGNTREPIEHGSGEVAANVPAVVRRGEQILPLVGPQAGLSGTEL